MPASNRVLGFRKAYHRVIDPTVGMYKRMFCSTTDDTTAIEPAYGQLP